MARKSKFNEAQVKEMVSMLKGKKPVIEIAKIMKTTPATVRSCLVKAGEYKVRKNKKRAGKKVQVIRQAATQSLESVSANLKEAKEEVKRLEGLVKKIIQRDQINLNKIKKNIGMK